MRCCIFLVVGACLTPKPLDDRGAGDDSGPDANVIRQVRTGEYATGEVVTVERAVVTGPKTIDEDAFFIQDPAGGEYSGIMVYGYGGVDDVYVEAGDEVTVVAAVAEYEGMHQLAINGPEAVTVTGTTELPAPEDVADGTAVADWEPWESTVVRLADQSVTAIDEFGAASLTGGLALDDELYRVDTACGDHFEALTGVVTWAFERWRLNPRWTDDVVGQAGGSTQDASVADVQEGRVCGSVMLDGVVATTDSWSDDGDAKFFVQDPGGGAWTGVLIHVPGAGVDVEAGSLVTLTGVANEFYGMTQIQAAAAEVDVAGSASETAERLTVPESDWESREGCLVTLEGVTVTGDADGFGQYPTDWGLLLDDELHRATYASGERYDSVTGVVVYDYSEWKLWPRSAADIVP